VRLCCPPCRHALSVTLAGLSYHGPTGRGQGHRRRRISEGAAYQGGLTLRRVERLQRGVLLSGVAGGGPDGSSAAAGRHSLAERDRDRSRGGADERRPPRVLPFAVHGRPDVGEQGDRGGGRGDGEGDPAWCEPAEDHSQGQGDDDQGHGDLLDEDGCWAHLERSVSWRSCGPTSRVRRVDSTRSRRAVLQTGRAGPGRSLDAGVHGQLGQDRGHLVAHGLRCQS
jgi:hypothetical protein